MFKVISMCIVYCKSPKLGLYVQDGRTPLHYAAAVDKDSAVYCALKAAGGGLVPLDKAQKPPEVQPAA